MSKEETREQILQTAMDLFAERGFSAVTTREIAEHADISEVTLFRYFPSKRNIFTSIIEELFHVPLFAKLGIDLFTWDLEADLKYISEMMKELMEKNSKIIKMNMKDVHGLSDNDDTFLNFPEKIKSLLTAYLTEYKRRNGARWSEELLAVTFLTTLFGLLMNFFVVKAFDTDVTYDEASSNLIAMIVARFK